MRLRGEGRLDGGTARWKLVENGDIQIAIESQRECSRYGCSGKHENMRRVAMGSGFVHEALALQNTEAVLLINRDKAEFCELYIVFDERMRAHHKLSFARLNALERGGFLRRFKAADEQLDVVAACLQHAARGQKMLDR